MGIYISKVMDLIGGCKKGRILMVGLDNAGKTTILYKLKINEVVTTVPTIGECYMGLSGSPSRGC